MGVTLYRDRRDAGRRLSARVERLRHEAPLVLAIPRGGVPVAVEVAQALAAPLDVLVVHKVGAPGERVGAVAEGGLAVIDHDRVRTLNLSAEALARQRDRAGADADSAARRLRDGAAPLDLVGRTVLIVDDGAGTGASAIAAARTARRRGAARIVLGLPVAGAAVLTRLGEEVDEIVCVEVEPLARWYEDSPASADSEIVAALHGERSMRDPRLHLPQAARGVIVLAAADELVRRTLDDMGFATLQIPSEDVDGLGAAVVHLRELPATAHLGLGLFGLGATASVVLAAAAAGRDVGAVVAAGGRPDRVAARIADLVAPTMLVLGGEDRSGLRLARTLSAHIPAPARYLAVVAGASHDFVEPGALGQVAHLAGGWFARHLTVPRTR
jgi:putative phosphoribosyl transferase